MQDLTGKNTGDQLTALEWNELPQEVQNVMTAFGATLITGNLNQLGQAIVEYVGTGSFYSDGGSADDYILSPIGGRQAPTAYFDGLTLRFRALNANLTTTPQVRISGLGAIPVVNEDNSAVTIGVISTTQDTVLRYDATLTKFFIMNFITAVTPINDLPRDYFTGFLHAKDVIPVDLSVTVTGGGACRDAANSQNIDSTANFTKRINAAWAEGDGNGGLASPLSLSADTWYRYFVIAKPNGTVDYGWDTSSTAAVLLDGSNAGAAGYTKYRQIGWHLTDGSSLIRDYDQQSSDPSRIMWGPGDVFSTALVIAAGDQLASVRAPTQADAILSYATNHDQGPNFFLTYLRLSSLDDSSPGAAGATNFDIGGIRHDWTSGMHGGWVLVKANASNQIRTNLSYLNTGGGNLVTLGYHYRP